MACKAIVKGNVKYSLFGITQIFKSGLLMYSRKALGSRNTIAPGILSQLLIILHVYAGCNLGQHSLQKSVNC